MANGPIVVLIMSHTDPAQVSRLTRAVLEGCNTKVVIHHDQKGPRLDVRASERVHIIQNSRTIRWGRPELAWAVLDSLEQCRRVVPDLSWVLVVSGQDMPIMPMAEIEADLDAANADAMLQHYEVTPRQVEGEHHWQTRCRGRYLRRRRVPFGRRSVPFPRLSPFSSSLKLFIGATWVNLNDRALDHIVRQRSRMTRVDRYLARCSNSDEALLPTLLLNDSAELAIVNDHRRFIVWPDQSPHPETLSIGHLESLAASGAYFARKFETAASSELLTEIGARSQ
ncbi:hypothetical protein MU582_18090 [Nocardioidaceae bacterium SCSIO 66511]|nr:hypothetical protein MU582_18090 [Nocardioidaceae bacterium SCSIO 66511]